MTTVELNRILTEAQELGELPVPRCVDFRVIHTDDTPADYVPPGFQ